MTAADQIAKIATVNSLPELEGYEQEARRRGFFDGEAAAIRQREKELRGHNAARRT